MFRKLEITLNQFKVKDTLFSTVIFRNVYIYNVLQKIQQ